VDWSTLRRWLEAFLNQILGQMERGDDRVVVASGAPRTTPTHDAVVVRAEQSIRIGPELEPRDRVSSALVIGPQPSLRVEPMPRPVWDDLGWIERDTGSQRIYEGDYVVTHRGGRSHFRGRIVERGATVAAYVADPPAAIKRHRKGPCFQLVEPPWFKVHWHRPARTVDDALLYVQRILHEVLN
jgi:hypothetical protein